MEGPCPLAGFRYPKRETGRMLVKVIDLGCIFCLCRCDKTISQGNPRHDPSSPKLLVANPYLIGTSARAWVQFNATRCWRKKTIILWIQLERVRRRTHASAPNGNDKDF